jgi:hypothetical protein
VTGRVTDDYRKAAMSSLRVAFLSGFVLELATALVAVEVGARPGAVEGEGPPRSGTRPLPSRTAAAECGYRVRLCSQKVRSMKTRHQARSYWLGTPPRPRSDRTETAMFGTLMTAFLAGSPFVAYAAGRWVSARLSRKADVQQASLRQVPATLLQTAPRCSGRGARVVRDTPAHWRAPDGQLRTGPIPAPGGTTAGSTVRVWVNQAGDLTGPPMQETKIANRTELAQGLAAGLFAVGLGAIGRRAGKRLDQRRMTA